MDRVSRDSFRVDGPTAISVSGGRTSAYMLWRVLESNGGACPDLLALFANTGKEDAATLRFVRDCAQRWDVSIRWVEFQAEDPGWKEVDFESAARDGEPFEALIRKRQYLPNPVARFCTSELKINAMHALLRAVRPDWEEWDEMVGIRADEPERVAKIRARPAGPETMRMPLADAGLALSDVDAFWRRQSFGLRLSTNEAGRTSAGNCDLCFLKPYAQRLSLIRERPERATWWARMEAGGIGGGRVARFRKDGPSYSELERYAARQRDLFDPTEFRPDPNEEAIPCFCGD